MSAPIDADSATTVPLQAHIPWSQYAGELAIVELLGGAPPSGDNLPAARVRVRVIEHDTGALLLDLGGTTTDRAFVLALAAVRRGAVLVGRIERDPDGRSGFMLDMPWISEALVLRQAMRQMELDDDVVI